jgi:hypothetical protein
MKTITVEGVKMYVRFESEDYYLVSITKNGAKFKIDKNENSN